MYMKKILDTIFRKTWSPYFAGLFIGFLQIPTFLFIGKTLGASTAYGMLTDFLIRTLGIYNSNQSPAVANATRFLDIHNWWYVSLLIGVALGAFLSSKYNRSDNVDENKKTHIINGWEFFGIKTKKLQMIFSFAGGFLMLFGARIASGCASGHGLSGIAKLQISSLITIISLFVFAIITVNVVLKLHRYFQGGKGE